MTAGRGAALGSHCARCGVPGHPHATPMDCINALRDQIAVLSFRRETKRGVSANAWRPGGRFPRSDNRWVVLDGQRMILTDAARKLGISNVALHFRLVNRTGGKDYDGVDIRAVRADRKHTPTEASRLAHAAKARIHAEK